MQTIVSTETFEQNCEAMQLGRGIDDRIVDLIAAEPENGRPLLGIDGLYLRTLKPLETGAEENIEVISYWAGEDLPVFLLDICFAGETLTITNSDRLRLAESLTSIAGEYRAGARAKVIEMKKARDGSN